jgi:hypothetical protein
LAIFDARHYQNKAKESEKWLSLYLSERLSKNEHGLKLVEKYI